MEVSAQENSLPTIDNSFYNPLEKWNSWKKELELLLNTKFIQIKEMLLYFISKKNLINIINLNDNSQLNIKNISSFHISDDSIEPDANFCVVNKTTWYTFKTKIKKVEKPFRKLGYFCNKKLLFIFDNLFYFLYRNKYRNKIVEGYISFPENKKLKIY